MEQNSSSQGMINILAVAKTGGEKYCDSSKIKSELLLLDTKINNPKVRAPSP